MLAFVENLQRQLTLFSGGPSDGPSKSDTMISIKEIEGDLGDVTRKMTGPPRIVMIPTC